MSKRTADEAELPQGGKEGDASQWVLSEKFNNSDGDIELRSSLTLSKPTRYLVHRANLQAGSKVFGDMLAIGSSSTDTSPRSVIQLEESSDILDFILPYLYPHRIAHWSPTFASERDVACLAAFDKYEIWRGIEVFESALITHLVTDQMIADISPLRRSLCTYAFFCHFNSSGSTPYREKAQRNVLEAVAPHSTSNWVHTLESTIIPPFLYASVDIPLLKNWIDSEFSLFKMLHADCTSKLIKQLCSRLQTHSCSQTKSNVPLLLLSFWNGLRDQPSRSAVLKAKYTDIRCGSCSSIVTNLLEDFLESFGE